MQYILSIRQYVLYMTYDDTDITSWQVNPLTAWQWQYIQINRQQVTEFYLVTRTHQEMR